MVPFMAVDMGGYETVEVAFCDRATAVSVVVYTMRAART